MAPLWLLFLCVLPCSSDNVEVEERSCSEDQCEPASSAHGGVLSATSSGGPFLLEKKRALHADLTDTSGTAEKASRAAPDCSPQPKKATGTEVEYKWARTVEECQKRCAFHSKCVQYLFQIYSNGGRCTILESVSSTANHNRFLTGPKCEGYVPLTPGAAWTPEETLTVKAKLWRLFSVGQSYKACEEAGVEGVCDWRSTGRLAPKFLRLGFHDCLKYTDGSGGCDGVLHWEGVGARYGETAGTYSVAANDTLSHNNGLGVAVQLLEELYTNPDFPSNTPSLPTDLRSAGKSRADLWAFAAIAAVEYGIQTNNGVCDDPDYEQDAGYGLDTNGGERRHCHHLRGSPECRVTLPRPIAFKTGRVDSASSFKGIKEEHMPEAEGNGQMTIEFFGQGFGFTGRETVAIMGSHTLGRLHNDFSLFKYIWVHAGGMMFNNQYYRNIVGKGDYRFVVTGNDCKPVGDAWGRAPPVRWVAHTRGDKVTGGPVHWIQEKLTCPEVCVTSKDNECCTKNVPAGATCRPDAGRGKGTDAVTADNDVNGGCEMYRFKNGHDEMALSAEIGLYYDFQVDENLIPVGCPGFKEFKMDKWKQHYKYSWTRAGGVKAEAGCPKNRIESPAGSTPLHEIVEEYADSQEAWIRDFVPALEKMLSNGYAQQDLVDGPDQWTGVSCTRKDFWVCVTSTTGATFYIVSDHDQRVLQHSDEGVLQLYSRAPGHETRQLWRWQGDDMLINALTNLPLVVNGFSTWEMRDQSSWYKPPAGHKVLASGNKCIDRGWSKEDRDTVNAGNCWGGPIQHWSLEDA